MITVLIMTDGRQEYFRKTYDSLWTNVSKFDNILIHDDSGSSEYAEWLRETFKTPDTTIYSTGKRSGFGGAIRSAWNQIILRDAEWVFHLEEDFTFNRPVNLQDMQGVLESRPQVAQMALRRQPWNAQEVTQGGVVELDPDSYLEVSDGKHEWLQHRNFFTTNPSLYSRGLVEDYKWPEGDRSEGLFSLNLFADPFVVSAYWGGMDSGEAVTHIGEERTGEGY